MHRNFYQHIYFTISRQLDYLFGEDNDTPPVWFTSYNPYDRCINTYQISYKLNELTELVPNIIGTFKVPANAVFLEKFFQCYADDRTLSPSVDIVKKMIKSDTPDADEFLYHLILLYHHFPRHPNLFIDGVVKNLLLNVARQGDTPVYGTINLLWNHPKLGYNTYPWLQIALFGRDGNPIAINPERKHQWVLIDQEDLDSQRILSDWPGEKLSPSTKVNDYLQEYNLIYDYLDPLFLKYEMSNGGPFTGESFYSEVKGEQQATQVEHLLLLPVYDFEIGGRILGNLTGNCIVPFAKTDETKGRHHFIENNLTSLRNKIATLPKSIRNARAEYAIASETWDFEDPLTEFLCKAPYIQDWECIVLFDKNVKTISACYSRPNSFGHTVNSKGGNDCVLSYKQSTLHCERKDLCKNCDLKTIENQLQNITNAQKGSGIISYEQKGQDICLFYYVDLMTILNHRVMTFIDEGLCKKYENNALCFQFPGYCLLGGEKKLKTHEKVEKITKYIGNLYFEELIPLLDKILLKLKVGHHAFSEGYREGDIESRQNMSDFLHKVLRHDLKNLRQDITHQLNKIKKEIKNSDKLVQFDRSTKSALNLYSATAEMDDLWKTDNNGIESRISLSDLKKELDKCWQRDWISNCEFRGDWNQKESCWQIVKIALINILRNALNHGGDGNRIIFCCKVLQDLIIFECLSHDALTNHVINKFFFKKLGEKIPRKNQGIWISRYIIEKRLGGKIEVGKEYEELKTNITITIPKS